ncbi:MAG: dTDP-6-deoxy-3,4-keto-hexulose isomerase [Bacteroidetes bacterium GWA2_31_9b]|nr:MAG: dTDP-6-deoxy-3,4-keto-hexulose isomerase [Bacteroidetes bacterium GWA2_31_9b]
MFNIHPTADVQTQKIGDNTFVWQFCVILEDAVIGRNCNINAHVLIEGDVIIGNNVTVKSGVQLWNGLRIDDDVFIGPNVTFTNDIVPRSKKYPDKFEQTIIERGASIGANATIIAGNKIGAYSLIGAGSLVTKNIPANSMWYGNPAKHKGYVTNDGILLDMDFKDKSGKKHNLSND